VPDKDVTEDEETVDPRELTVAQLKHELDQAGVTYERHATKQALVAAVRELRVGS
jgi:hypothetical protein